MFFLSSDAIMLPLGIHMKPWDTWRPLSLAFDLQMGTDDVSGWLLSIFFWPAFVYWRALAIRPLCHLCPVLLVEIRDVSYKRLACGEVLT